VTRLPAIKSFTRSGFLSLITPKAYFFGRSTGRPQDCRERREFRRHRDDEESWDSQGSSQTSQLSPNPMRLFNPPQLPWRLFLPNNTPTAIPKTARRRTPKLMRKISTTAPFNPQEIVRFLELPFLYTHVRFE